MFVREEWTEVSERGNIYLGDSAVYEAFTDDVGVLFTSLQKEYGRCTGKIYVDPDNKQVGWIFEKHKQYDDSNDTFLLQTWVTLHNGMPKRTITYDYHYLTE